MAVQVVMRFWRCLHPPGRVRVEGGGGKWEWIGEDCLLRRRVEWSDEKQDWIEIKSWNVEVTKCD